jgi:hypothetical protein
MNNLRRLGNRISIPIHSDADGFTGRECPQPDCEGYFKVQFGTGLKGEGLPCHCPYCGHTAGHDHFWTKEQIEYAKSVAMRKIADAFHEDLKKLEFDHKPQGAFGIGFSMKVERGQPTPIRYYREKQLETEVVCLSCTLRYSVYGVFAFCPDCGKHNSLQILDKNLELIEKMLGLAANAEKDIADRLIENALEDCVSAFDGFGRELCRVHAKKAANPAKAEKTSFQNLDGAKTNILAQFGIDLAAPVSAEEWNSAVLGFQRRHLLAHKMGVVDENYAAKSTDTKAVVGRKIVVDGTDVRAVLQAVRKIALGLSERMHGEASTSEVKA